MLTQTKVIDLHPDVKINTIISITTNKTNLPTVIFLHFWGGSSRTWSLVNPIVSGKGYPTVAIDFRGWGDSTGPPKEEAYFMSALADDVEAVIATLKIPQSGGVVLVGLSMGAKVAQLIAARGNSSPQLRGLVLVSPSPATPLTLPPDMREQQLHAYDSEESANFVARNVLTVSYRDSDNALPTFLVEDMLCGNEWARMAWPAYGMAEDVSKGIEEILLPVLVLAADQDVVEPVERVNAEVGARIKGSRLVIIQGSGHLSPLDRPEAVAGHLLEFLGAL